MHIYVHVHNTHILFMHQLKLDYKPQHRPVGSRSRESISAGNPPRFTEQELEVFITVDKAAQCLVIVFKL